MLQKFISAFRPKAQSFALSEHQINQEQIASAALKTIRVLQAAGYEAYVVGGGLRDLLLGLHPKDFDVVTDARPEQIKKLFKRCYIIGRRFRLAHVYQGREMIEVSTFRSRQAENEPPPKRGARARDAIYGDINSDYIRRDLTINALYYDPNTEQLHDFSGGYEDLQRRRLRMIGAAPKRFQQDPMRILRVLRFAAKLDFTIDPSLSQHIRQHHHLLHSLPSARLLDEYYKFFYYGHAQAALARLREYDLLTELFPQLDTVYQQGAIEQQQLMDTLLDCAIANTDARVNGGQSTAKAFLVAVFYWHPLQIYLRSQPEELSPRDAFYESLFQCCQHQNQMLRFPKHINHRAGRILYLQHQLEQPQAPFDLVNQADFRAAYDLLCLRRDSGEFELEFMADWWTRFQEHKSRNQRLALCAEIGLGIAPKRRKRSRKTDPAAEPTESTTKPTNPADPTTEPTKSTADPITDPTEPTTAPTAPNPTTEHEP